MYIVILILTLNFDPVEDNWMWKMLLFLCMTRINLHCADLISKFLNSCVMLCNTNLFITFAVGSVG